MAELDALLVSLLEAEVIAKSQYYDETEDPTVIEIGQTWTFEGFDDDYRVFVTRENKMVYMTLIDFAKVFAMAKVNKLALAANK